MTKIRILVVDDSVVVRKLVTDVLTQDPELEVAGVAPNGRIALAKILQLAPDLVTLDVDMPELDGLSTLRAIRALHPRLPVIMFSTLTQRAAGATLEALAFGASDYVTKPANVGHVGEAMQRVRESLIPKIKQLCFRRAGEPPPAAARTQFMPRPPLPQVRKTTPAPVRVVAIGVSTGGPNALAALLPALPADFPAPIVIVQHMPPMFTRLLSERLDESSSVSVREGEDGAVLAPGVAWIAPGDFHMLVRRDGAQVKLSLSRAPHENSCRPAVDVLFRSTAEVFGAGTLAVVLTGMGQDGLRGAQATVDAGGRVLAQDEASSVVWGMPGFVARAGLADKILPLAEVAGELLRLTASGSSDPRPRAVES